MTAKNNHSELIDQLTEGIANLTSSESWQHYLDFQSRFHRYSFGNVLLIAAQCHEATRVAGFNAWRKMNRFVRKGEKAIWILAPMVYKNADTEAGENDRVIRGFKFVGVFDVAQTDGEELPSICNRIDGDDPAGLYAQLVTVAESIGFSVEDHEFVGSTNGDCTYDLHRIRVESQNTPAQRVKTLAHEITHALFHEGHNDRALAELEAESTAYVVCRALGIDSSDYSFGYVATWAGGNDEAQEAIRVSGSRIQRAADTILTALGGEDRGGGVMYTVTDLTELIRHHLMLSTDDAEKADVSLVQLMRNIEQMVAAPRWRNPISWIVCEKCGAWVSSELLGADGAGEREDGGFRCTECRFADDEQ